MWGREWVGCLWKRMKGVKFLLVCSLVGLAACGNEEGDAGVGKARGLVVEDALGRARIVMKVGRDGSPSIRLMDGFGHCRLELAVSDPHWGAQERKEGDEDFMKEYACWSGGLPSITMYDRGNKARIKLGVELGWLGMRYFERDGNLAMELCREWGKGGVLRMGNGRVELLEKGADGKPHLILWQPLSKRVDIFPKPD